MSKQYEFMKPIIPTEKLKKQKLVKPSTSTRELLAQKTAELEKLRTSTATREKLRKIETEIQKERAKRKKEKE